MKDRERREPTKANLVPRAKTEEEPEPDAVPPPRQVRLRRRSQAELLRYHAARLLGHPTTSDIMAAAVGMEAAAEALERAEAWTDGTDNLPEHHGCPHCGGQFNLLYPADAVEEAAAAKDQLIGGYNAMGDLLEAHIDATSRLLRLVRPHDPARLTPSPDPDDQAVMVEADPGLISPQYPG